MNRVAFVMVRAGRRRMGVERQDADMAERGEHRQDEDERTEAASKMHWLTLHSGWATVNGTGPDSRLRRSVGGGGMWRKGLVGVALAVELDAAGVPRAQGWIGTVNDWARGLGLGFAAVELALLLFAFLALRRHGVTRGLKEALVVGIVGFPLAITFFGYQYGLEASKSVDACAACHVMQPFVRDLRDPASETLAALHFKNRYIQREQCYTCHTDYGMAGTVRAKLEGLEHVVRNVTGTYTLPITISHPYSNVPCLYCHAASQRFLHSSGHPGDLLPQILNGRATCLDCHGPVHPSPDQRAAR